MSIVYGDKDASVHSYYCIVETCQQILMECLLVLGESVLCRKDNFTISEPGLGSIQIGIGIELELNQNGWNWNWN